MSALTERLIAARDRIKPLTRYGEDNVWRPAQNAHEVMADAANAITDLVGALQTARGICRDAFKDTGMEWDDEAMSRIDAALAKAGAQ